MAFAWLPCQAAASAGAPSIFLQAMDIVPLTVSLAVIIFLTIFFENVLHKLKHKYEEDPIIGAVVNKINAEFTVLGFVSIIVVLLLNSDFIQWTGVNNHVAEFEVAHVWLFLVGWMYVIEAFVFLRQAVRASKTYKEFSHESNDNIISKLDEKRTNPTPRQRTGIFMCKRLVSTCGDGCCGCCKCCNATMADQEEAAGHVMRGFFFKQVARTHIFHEMGRSRSVLFDFSSYMTQFWKREIVTCLEISPLSWLGFFLLVWCVGIVLPRQLISNYSQDLSMIGHSQFVTVCLAAVFAIFVMLVIRDAGRLDRIVAGAITGDNQKCSTYNAVKHLARISDNTETFDADGHTWPQPSHEEHGFGHEPGPSTDSGAIELIDSDNTAKTSGKESHPDNGSKSEPKSASDSLGANLSEFKDRERKATLQRIHNVVHLEKTAILQMETNNFQHNVVCPQLHDWNADFHSPS